MTGIVVGDYTTSGKQDLGRVQRVAFDGAPRDHGAEPAVQLLAARRRHVIGHQSPATPPPRQLRLKIMTEYERKTAKPAELLAGPLRSAQERVCRSSARLLLVVEGVAQTPLALQPLGQAASGPIAVAIGLSATLYGAGGLTLILLLTVLAVPAVRNFRIGDRDCSCYRTMVNVSECCCDRVSVTLTATTRAV